MRNILSKKHQYNKPSLIIDAVNKSKLYDDVVNLSVGDPDLDTDKSVLEGMYQDVLKGATHYTNPQGEESLREAIVLENKEDYNLEFTKENVFVATSASHALFLSLEAIIDQGDEVIAFGPYFSSYKTQVELVGGVFVEVPTFVEENFQINTEALEKYITPKTKALIINTPSNPTGVCYSFETLKKLREIVLKHDLVVISDEIYTIFTYKDKFIPFIELPDMFERTITIRSCSKDYCMTGFRIGYIVATEEVVNAINTINESVVYSAPSPSQKAAYYAIKNRHNIRQKVYEEFKARSEYCYNRLKEIDIFEPVKPEGTIYIFVDIRKSKMNSIDFCNWLLDKYHILVLPGILFGDSGEGFIRIALTVGIDKLKMAFDRFDTK